MKKKKEEKNKRTAFQGDGYGGSFEMLGIYLLP